MITFFTCPKPFRGHIDIIQRNAIKSWLQLKPKPEIILLGEDEGVAEVCKELNLVHVREIEKNEYGTPLVSSVFQIGQARASNSICCYVNADIMLMSDFVRAVETVTAKISKYLILGQRWDADINQPWDFDQNDWESILREWVGKNGKLHAQTGIDFFLFPKGTYRNVPPFAIGRWVWDTWLVWRVKKDGLPIVDITKSAMVVHQNHGYAANALKKLEINKAFLKNARQKMEYIRVVNGEWFEKGPEEQRNMTLAPGSENLHIWAANWVVNSKGVLKKHPLELSYPYIKYQVKNVLPFYLPLFGRLIQFFIDLKRTVYIWMFHIGLKPLNWGK